MKAAQTMTTVREDPTAMAMMTFVAENEIELNSKEILITYG
jgi:hypothetical protein